jgi:two-component system cell cycle sensor histidine kinase/response regulator CckA
MKKSTWFISIVFFLVIICGFLCGLAGYVRTGLILFLIALATYYGGKAWFIVKGEEKRRRVEEALRKKQRCLEEIIDFLPDATLVIDNTGKVTAWNRAIEQMTGVKAEEMIGKGDYEYAIPFYGERRPILIDLALLPDETFLAGHYDDISRQDAILSGEVFVPKTYGGKGAYLWATASKLFDADGNVIGAIESIRDITNRKSLEKALRESEEKYRELVKNANSIILRMDTQGNVTFFNDYASRFFGFSLDEIIGRNVIGTIVPPTDSTGKDLTKMIRDIGVHRELYKNNENENICMNGTRVWVAWTNTPILDDQGRCVEILCIGNDITERRRMQDELLKAQKLESLGLLAGGIAHDFNNILTGIVGNLSIARLQIDPSHKIVKRLEQSEKAALQATGLTQQLLTFARGGEPVKKLINPAPLIRETVSFALRGSNIRSIIDIQDNLWSMEVDESQLNQVLNNLILNAGQAMPAGGDVIVRGANEPLLHDNPHQLPPGDYLRISVEDQGCGIPQENLVRIFDPYFTTKPKGSGLGLASVYSIVKRHGGSVEVSSTPEAGTSFTVHIPALPGRLPEDAGADESVELMGSGRVLVMDDDDLIREIATDILDFMGYEVDSCADGREAVERFRAARYSNDPFSAVILDLTVPGGMGGKEASSRILEIDPDAVLIVSSGYSDDPVIANFRQFGFSGAVPKPFDAEGLARELKRLIPKTG